MNLHRGKLDTRIETSVPEAFADFVATLAHQQGITKADAYRELLFFGATSYGYSFHVAKDKADSFAAQLASVRGKYRIDSGDQP